MRWQRAMFEAKGHIRGKGPRVVKGQHEGEGPVWNK